MNRKPIYLTRHATQRALRYNLTSELVERIVREGERRVEGKTKSRYVLSGRRGVWVAICEEYSDQIIILTITGGR